MSYTPLTNQITQRSAADEDSAGVINTTYITLPHIKIKIGRKVELARSMEELNSICVKNDIKALRMDMIQFLVDTQDKEFAIYFKDAQITNFRLLYEVCSKISKKDTPFFIPILGWRGQIKVQWQNPKLRFYYLTIVALYIFISILTVYLLRANGIGFWQILDGLLDF